MQAAHISNLQRGVVPNVLDSLYLGPGPEQRVKEASFKSFKATFVTSKASPAEKWRLRRLRWVR